MAANKIAGIDLGTTYSCIACVSDSGKPEVIPNVEGEPTTPSVIYFESADNIVVGKVAKNSAKIYPDRTFAFIKREMGHEAVFQVDGKPYKPEELSSFVLRKLVKDASLALGEEITDVVITCPAYFGINEREATKNAGQLAGLKVRHILNEPSAAAFCYGLDQRHEDQVVLVYDLGGGTFDITMIEVRGGNVRVVYTDGIHSLGGKDWDDRLVNHFSEQFMAQYPDKGDPRDDPESLQALVIDAEEAKKGLSSREKWPISVAHAGCRARLELTREKLEELTADLLGQTIELTKRVVEKGTDSLKKEIQERTGQEPEEVKVDRILLVGGSSLMPAVSRRLTSEVGIELQMFEPHLSVAKGAALVGLKILAGELIKEEIAATQGKPVEQVDLGQVDSQTLNEAARKVSEKAGPAFRLPGKELAAMATGRIVNVTSKGFGVVVSVGERFEREEVHYLIHNNTRLPVEVTETTFGTLRDNQRTVKIRVMEQAGQEESPLMDNNIELQSGEIAGLPPALPAGSPIHVAFCLEEDGTLKVRAEEPSSGQQLTLEVAARSGVMSQEEIEEVKGLLLQKQVS